MSKKVKSQMKTEEGEMVKLEVKTIDIKGIIYFVDKFNNIYNTENIIKGVINPEIVGVLSKKNTSSNKEDNLHIKFF